MASPIVQLPEAQLRPLLAAYDASVRSRRWHSLLVVVCLVVAVGLSSVSAEVSLPKLFANITCSDAVLLPGHLITINKTYDGTGGVSHSVVYTGTVSADMRSISGRWVVNNAHGNFTMSR